jgi:hypothetical protein
MRNSASAAGANTMTDANLNTDVVAVFYGLLRARRGSIVAQKEAEEIVVRRKRLLSIYTQPGIPAELQKDFEEAIKLTDGCDKFAQNSVSLLLAVTSLGKLSVPEMLISARLYLDSVRLPPGAPVDDEPATVRDRVLLALTTAARDTASADELVTETLDKELADLPVWQRQLAPLEAYLLMAQVKQWKQAFEVIALSGQLAIICRNMLYRGLIETLGSRLERQASWERFKEDLREVPTEAAGAIPVIGDAVGKMKLLVDMASHLFDKEAALEAEAADLITKQRRAREFVDLYTASIKAWVSWAVPITTSINDMSKKVQRQLAGQATADQTPAG